MQAIVSAVDSAISSPTLTNAQGVVTTCASVIQNCRDSLRSVTENPSASVGSHATSNRHPAIEFQELADQVRKDALTIQAKGALTDAAQWRKLKRTCITNGACPHYTTRPTTD